MIQTSELKTVMVEVDPKNVKQASVAPPENTVKTVKTVDAVVRAIQEPMTGATKLKRKLEDTDELIVCPGVYDGLSARIALEVGFSAMYMVCLPTIALMSSMRVD